MSKTKDLSNPDYYYNRELSWLKFEERILGEVFDKANPLLERIKFLAITASNLDEFFMVRVASIKDMIHSHYSGADISGLTAPEQMTRISDSTHKFVKAQYDALNKSLNPLLLKENIVLALPPVKWNDEINAFVDSYFDETVYPVLTPMAVDSSRPFPLVRNKSLNIALLTKRKGKNEDLQLALVQVPSVLERFVKIPGDENVYIMLEDIIQKNLYKLFSNFEIVSFDCFRIMRNADFSFDEDTAYDLLKEIEKQIKKRQRGDAIKLEVGNKMDNDLLKRLVTQLNVSAEDVYKIPGPLDLSFLMSFYSKCDRNDLKYVKHIPVLPEFFDREYDIFELLKKQDIMLHHPFESFSPVIDFVQKAAKDPKVLAIKQTLYRVSGDSPIVKALAEAAENGKQVTVLVELKARFDEENNIVWAKMLEKAGCHVIYGLVGLKTHCKITLIVRNEESGIQRYVHLGTGNYNDSTAKLYTDIGFFTSRDDFGEDASALFNMLSGYCEPKGWNRLAVAPLWLKDKILSLIERETDNALAGKPSGIIAKMNSLCDNDVITALYKASNAGVKIQLIVRGICCLKVGIPGVSENISVVSIVGNFLEHSRIFYFENDSNPEYYCASADWMPRNLERRVEVMFPVLQEDIKRKLDHILKSMLKDNVKASYLTVDGSYKKVDMRGKKPYCFQQEFVKETLSFKRASRKCTSNRTFVPRTTIVE